MSYRPGMHTVGERLTTMCSDPYRNRPDLLTVEEAATVLRMSKKAVYNLLHIGELKSFRIGRHFRIREADLHAYQERVNAANVDAKFNIELPQSIIDSFARHLVSEIRKYYDSEKGQAAFKEWLTQQEDA